MGRALLLLTIGAAITLGGFYPQQVQRAIDKIIPPDEPAVGALAPAKPAPIVSERGLQECVDACETRGIIEHLADMTVRACKNGCRARMHQAPRETPRSISVAPATH